MPSLFRRRSLHFLKTGKLSLPGTRDEELDVPPLPPPKDIERLTVSTSHASKSSTSLSRKASKTSSDVMRRMSTMLKPNGSGRKKKLSHSSTYGAPVGHVVSRKKTKKGKKFPKELAPSFHSSRTDSIDEIRRPSGLGDSVSIHSQKSLPPTSPYSEKNNAFSWDEDPKSNLIRTASTPNLLATYKWKGEVNIAGFDIPAFQGSSSKKSEEVEAEVIGKPLPDLPVEVLGTILSYLPRNSIADLARVSKVYRMASRTVLYRHLDLEDIAESKVMSLMRSLASSSEIADTFREFHCEEWPSPFSPVKDGDIPSSSAQEFALALERMTSLTSLSLPDFDSDLVHHHAAFGLTRMIFHMREFPEDDMPSLLSWLDGQVNITSLAFPHLQDEPEQTKRKSSMSSHFRSMTSPDLSAPLLPPKITAFLTPNTSPSSTPLNTPQSMHFPPGAIPDHPLTQSNSPTLLPRLQFLHAPTRLVESLTPSRPLKHVFLNVNTTLYSGLRPGKLMSSMQGITKLTIRFGEQVDRRTVEKLLGAVGTALGSGGPGFSPLEELEVQVYFSDPGSEDVSAKLVGFG